MATFGQPFERKALSLLPHLEAAASRLRTVELCAGHGSYLPGHVIVGNRNTTAIALDDYEVAPPARRRDFEAAVVGTQGDPALGYLTPPARTRVAASRTWGYDRAELLESVRGRYGEY